MLALLSFLLSSLLHHDHIYTAYLINTLSWWWCSSHGPFFLMWAVQVAVVMNHPLFMSLDNFKLSINWNETTGFVRLIDLFWLYAFLSSQKRNCQCLPRNGRDSCFEKRIYGMIDLACAICSPVYPEGSYHLVNPFTLERWTNRQFQKLDQPKLISAGNSLHLHVGCMRN